MGMCRYYEDGHCVYWDEAIHDSESIRCEGPGGWSEECYTETSYGVIFDPATGKFYTETDYAAELEERRKDEISDYEHDQVRSLRVLDQETLEFLMMDRNAPEGRDG